MIPKIIPFQLTLEVGEVWDEDAWKLEEKQALINVQALLQVGLTPRGDWSSPKPRPGLSSWLARAGRTLVAVQPACWPVVKLGSTAQGKEGGEKWREGGSRAWEREEISLISFLLRLLLLVPFLIFLLLLWWRESGAGWWERQKRKWGIKWDLKEEYGHLINEVSCLYAFKSLLVPLFVFLS